MLIRKLNQLNFNNRLTKMVFSFLFFGVLIGGFFTARLDFIREVNWTFINLVDDKVEVVYGEDLKSKVTMTGIRYSSEEILIQATNDLKILNYDPQNIQPQLVTFRYEVKFLNLIRTRTFEIQKLVQVLPLNLDLPIVSFDQVEADNIYWPCVDDASSYDIFIDDVFYDNVDSCYFILADLFENESHEIKVKSISTLPYRTNSNLSNEVFITWQRSIPPVTYDGTKLQWTNNGSSFTHYEVTINNSVSQTTVPSINYALQPGIEYTIRIKGYSNENATVYSTNKVQLYTLLPEIDPNYDRETMVLSFAIEGAEEYEIIMNENPLLQRNGDEIDLSETFGIQSFSIKAISNNPGILENRVKSFQILTKINLFIETDMIYWDIIEGSTYSIILNNQLVTSNPLINNFISAFNPAFVWNPLNLVQIKIHLKSGNLINNLSEVISVTRFERPTISILNHELTILNKSNDLHYKYFKDLEGGSFGGNLTDLEAGNFYINVIATSKRRNELSSERSNIIEITKPFIQINIIKSTNQTIAFTWTNNQITIIELRITFFLNSEIIDSLTIPSVNFSNNTWNSSRIVSYNRSTKGIADSIEVNVVLTGQNQLKNEYLLPIFVIN